MVNHLYVLYSSKYVGQINSSKQTCQQTDYPYITHYYTYFQQYFVHLYKYNYMYQYMIQGLNNCDLLDNNNKYKS